MILLGPVVKEGLGMRKTISTILATALLLAGLWRSWLFWGWFTASDASGRLPILLLVLGPFVAILGGAWLWEDWRKA
jgi:hypothetical protein